MISYISGTIEAVIDQAVIVSTGEVGYRVVLPERMHSILSKVGSKVKLFIYSYFSVRDGKFEFYGFEKSEELAFFGLLLTVSGVGPKSAQHILSVVDLQTLQLAIVKGDADYLKKLGGIGPKSAQRIILELKTKLLDKDFGVNQDRDFASESEAIDALVALGYSAYNAREALKDVPSSANTSENKIKEALKILGNYKK